MEEPLQISYRNMQENQDLTDFIYQRVGKLEKIFSRIICCHIAVEKTQKTKEPGGLCRVRLELNLPKRHTIIIKKERKISSTYLQLAALISETLSAATKKIRKLKEKDFSAEKKLRQEF